MSKIWSANRPGVFDPWVFDPFSGQVPRIRLCPLLKIEMPIWPFLFLRGYGDPIGLHPPGWAGGPSGASPGPLVSRFFRITPNFMGRFQGEPDRGDIRPLFLDPLFSESGNLGFPKIGIQQGFSLPRLGPDEEISMEILKDRFLDGFWVPPVTHFPKNHGRRHVN